jgi:hypothetical protein
MAKSAATANALNIFTSGGNGLALVPIGLPAGDVTSITFVTGGQAISGGSNQWFALLDLSRNVLAVTSDDTSAAWGTNAAKTLPLTAPYTVATAGTYYLGVNIVATTRPSFSGAAAVAAGVGALAPTHGRTTNTLTSPPALPYTAAVTPDGWGTGFMYAYCS